MAQHIEYDPLLVPVGQRFVLTNSHTPAAACAMCVEEYQPVVLSKEPRQAYRSFIELNATFINKPKGGRS